MRSIRCGKILVQGEAEEIIVSPKPRSRLRHGKRSNLYSARGLDKFENVYAELSARRVYISNKTGAPEALVRFSYWEDGWVPVVVRAREGIWKKNNGGDAAGLSILGPVEDDDGEKDRELGRKDEGDDINGESESISISVFDGRSHSPVMPWSQFIKTRAFGILRFSAMWVRKSAAPAAAVMAVGGGMSMKNFIQNGVSYFAGFSRNPETNPKNPETSKNGKGDEAIVEQKDVGKITGRTPSPGLNVSVPSCHVRAHVEFSASPRAVKPKNIDPDHHHHHSKAKKIRRVVAVDNRPNRSAGAVQGTYRRTRQTMAYDTSLSAAVFIIMLFCLVFSGRLCAIFFTSAWWYLIPVMRMYERNQ